MSQAGGPVVGGDWHYVLSLAAACLQTHLLGGCEHRRQPSEHRSESLSLPRMDPMCPCHRHTSWVGVFFWFWECPPQLCQPPSLGLPAFALLSSVLPNTRWRLLVTPQSARPLSPWGPVGDRMHRVCLGAAAAAAPAGGGDGGG